MKTVFDISMWDLPKWILEGDSLNEKRRRCCIALDRIQGYRGPNMLELLIKIEEIDKSIWLQEN